MDDLPDQDESDIRRRAAWLLFMLAVVAALFVTLFVTVFNNSGGDNSANVDDVTGPTDPATSQPAPSSPAPGSSTSTSGAPFSGAPSSGIQTSGTPSGSTSGSPTGSTGASSSAATSASCPSDSACALPTDIGNAVAAINAYRTQHGKSAVPGAWSADAAQCALDNGSGCSGGWAETQLSKADGAAAVKKIAQRGKLDSDMKSIEVGWAYDPKAKTFYFAIIRRT